MEPDVSYRSLLEKFDRTRKELSEAEFTIKRLTGRDPDEIGNSTSGPKFRRYPNQLTYTDRDKRTIAGKKRPFSMLGKDGRAQSPDTIDDESPVSEDDDSQTKKPSIASTVVAATSSIRKSRKAIIEEQNVNSKIKARNRRMFGALIGTLERFQDEEKKRKESMKERAVIEQKVEAATEEEREKIKREKEQLFSTRREKQVILRCLEKKLERAELYEAFESSYKNMLNFIMTKSKPSICFLPSSHTPSTKKCLEESQKKVQETLDKHKKTLESDLAELDECYKRDSVACEASKDTNGKENECPKDKHESEEDMKSDSESLVVEQETGIDEEDSTEEKKLPSLTDQEFEPIYD